MRKRFNYHCVECGDLMAESNEPLDTPTTCWKCDNKHAEFMSKRRKEPINIDEDGKRRDLFKNIKKKRYKKCYY